MERISNRNTHQVDPVAGSLGQAKVGAKGDRHPGLDRGNHATDTGAGDRGEPPFSLYAPVKCYFAGTDPTAAGVKEMLSKRAQWTRLVAEGMA